MESIACNKRFGSMKPSASMALTARARELQKTDPTIIGLAGGEPDFPTPDRICMEAVRYLSQGYTHYCAVTGIPELRSRIQKKLEDDNCIRCQADDILIMPGGKFAIYAAVNALLNEGEEVILLNPAWVSYEPIILSAGAVPVNVPLDYRKNYEITLDALEAAATPRTKMLIINYPNNPTGRVLSRREADAVEAFMLAHPEVLLLSDEIYEKLLYDGNENISMASYESIRARTYRKRLFQVCGYDRLAYCLYGRSKGVYRADYKAVPAQHLLCQCIRSESRRGGAGMHTGNGRNVCDL